MAEASSVDKTFEVWSQNLGNKVETLLSITNLLLSAVSLPNKRGTAHFSDLPGVYTEPHLLA